MNKKYLKFSETVRKNILDYLPSEYKDCRVEVLWREEEPFLAVYGKENISPMIPLVYYFEKTNGIVSQEIMKDIVELYLKAMQECPVNIKDIYDFNNVKDAIYPKLLRKKGNKSLMDSSPYKTLSDLIIAYYVKAVSKDRKYTVTVDNHLLELYGISAEQLHELALTNMLENHHPILVSLDKFLEHLHYNPEYSELAGIKSPLMILSDEGDYGAVRILDDNLVDEAAEYLGEEFYIFPSSIHELILCPLNDIPPEVAMEIQKDINNQFLKESEVLSSNVYIYNSKKHKLKKYVKQRSS